MIQINIPEHYLSLVQDPPPKTTTEECLSWLEKVLLPQVSSLAWEPWLWTHPASGCSHFVSPHHFIHPQGGIKPTVSPPSSTTVRHATIVSPHCTTSSSSSSVTSTAVQVVPRWESLQLHLSNHL